MEERFKYPKTPHLPWSPGVSRDDKVLKDIEHFRGKKIVATIKMDGENTTLYSDYIHARSIDSKDHPSRHWVKALHQKISYMIPKDWRVCGENLYAKHSIYYSKLPSYFMVFAVWNDKNVCLSWPEIREFCEKLGLCTVIFMHIDEWKDNTPEIIRKKFESLASEHEGYVVRLYDSFRYEDFDQSVAKYVRKNHVQTEDHWMYQEIIKNQLRKEI